MCEECRKALLAHTKHRMDDPSLQKFCTDQGTNVIQEAVLNKQCPLCVMENLVISMFASWVLNTRIDPYSALDAGHEMLRMAIISVVSTDAKNAVGINPDTGHKVDIFGGKPH